MANINREDSFYFWDINNEVAPDPMTRRTAENTPAADTSVKKETNLQHRKKVLAELAKQGVIPIKQKRGKHLERYLCFYKSNSVATTQAADTAVKKETNLQHRKKVLAELAKQGVIPIKQKRGKRLERYFCFYKNNAVQHHGEVKPVSLTPACSKDDVTEKYLESTRI